MKLLLVDDIAEQRWMFARAWDQPGWVTETLESLPPPEEVWGYDLALYDFLLPEGDLGEHLRQVAKLGANRQPPVIVIFSDLPEYLLAPEIAHLQKQCGLELHYVDKVDPPKKLARELLELKTKCAHS